MSRKTSAFKTTIVGGVVFLVPFVLLLALFGKVYELMRAIALPITGAMGIDRVGAVAVVNVVTLLVTVAICYLAGLAATSERGQRLYRRIDDRLLDIFPRYSFIKAMASGLAQEEVAAMKVVMIRFDDQSQLGFEVERTAEQVVVFLPGSPDPWSGAVCFVTPDRVAQLDVDFNVAVKKLRLAGRGASQLLQGLPAGGGGIKVQ